ncbi:MAG: SHOCT domain-containing protein [Actinomycetota bacterium]|nr:SHOCT domain-containing protein [Actinomycetota bacterium]
MMGWNDGGWGAGQWVAMSLMMLLFWVAVIALGVWLVRSVRSTPTTPEAATVNDGAERLLAERFARGEIDEAEFARSRTLLRTSPAKETLR